MKKWIYRQGELDHACLLYAACNACYVLTKKRRKAKEVWRSYGLKRWGATFMCVGSDPLGLADSKEHNSLLLSVCRGWKSAKFSVKFSVFRKMAAQPAQNIAG